MKRTDECHVVGYNIKDESEYEERLRIEQAHAPVGTDEIGRFADVPARRASPKPKLRREDFVGPGK